jgi:hypothetical protein
MAYVFRLRRKVDGIRYARPVLTASNYRAGQGKTMPVAHGRRHFVAHKPEL